MSVVPVADVLQGRVAVDSEVTVRGWVRTRRDYKAGFSFLAVYDGSCFDPLQAVVNNSLPNYQDEVLHLTDKVQSLSKKSAGNRPANTSSLMNYIKSLSGNTKGMALYGRVKEELIRRGVIAVYEKTVVWR